MLSLAPNGSVPRERLAGMLWSDRGDEQARHSLRQCLLSLRKELGGASAAAIVSTHDEVQLDRAQVAVDAWAFEALCKAGTAEALRDAVRLHRGELADGLALRSEGFEEWLATQRAHWRQRFVDASHKLIGLLTEAGDDDGAIDAAQRLLGFEPANEEAHRALMTLYARSGRRAAALQQYQRCVEALRRHLDAEPDEATRRLHDELRRAAGQAAPEPEAPAPVVPEPEPAETTEAARPAAFADQGIARPMAGTKRRRLAVLAAAGAAVAVAVVLVVVFALQPGERIAPADPSAMAFALPDNPSIAVLPFRDISGGRAPAGLTQGMTEDITTALASIPEIFVIAPAAARVYAGQNETPGRVAEALGVRWVLDGSIQQVEDRVRISAQLIDAVRGVQVWADRYDRAIEDVFVLQDEITLGIVSALELTLARGETPPRVQKHGTRNLDAWLAASEGQPALRRLTRADTLRARALYSRAAELDPGYSSAWEGVAWSYYIEARFNWADDPAAALATAGTLVQKAIALDPTRGRCYSLLGSIMLIRGDHDMAVSYGERAIELSPSDSEALALLANTLSYTAELERSLAVMEKAMRLSPSFPAWYAWNMARILRLLGRTDEAVTLMDAHLSATDESLAPRIELILALVQRGELERAKREAATVAALEPGFSARRWMAVQPYADRAVAAAEAALLEQAGLPP
ncbi:MAG: BTAD domain-containing putative transcriptional regulator [Alphaproteobacteria bacterium]